MPESKLKPCPFCGGEAAKRKYRFERKVVSAVMCMACGSRSPMFLGENIEGAIKAWNRRSNNGS